LKIKEVQRPLTKKEKKGTEIDSEAGESEKDTLIKNKIKFSSCIRKSQRAVAKSYVTNGLLILVYGETFAHSLIY
jgi:hypothetical protein